METENTKAWLRDVKKVAKILRKGVPLANDDYEFVSKTLAGIWDFCVGQSGYKKAMRDLNAVNLSDENTVRREAALRDGLSKKESALSAAWELFHEKTGGHLRSIRGVMFVLDRVVADSAGRMKAERRSARKAAEKGTGRK